MKTIAVYIRKLFRRPRPTLSRLDALLEAENFFNADAASCRQVLALQDLVEKTATYAFQMQSERDAERRVRVVAQEIIKSMGGTVGQGRNDAVSVRKDMLEYMHRLICELPK